MSKVPPITLSEVIEKLHEKLDEAQDFLGDMETLKKDQTRFTHRVSAFLSAADSTIMMIEKHAKRYAREHGKVDEFNHWYEMKKDIFRKPDEARKTTKAVGSDATWVYLRAARDDTIHIERTTLNQLVRINTVERVHISDGIRVVEYHDDGTPTVVIDIPPEPLPPPEPDETKVETDLWAFRPIELVDNGRNIIGIINPPPNDVVSLCKEHIGKLIALVGDCEQELSIYP